MGWVETKHALNSSLGTSSFLPLDKKIDNLKTAIGVKSIQSGIVAKGTETTGYENYLFFGGQNNDYPQAVYMDITISAVNKNKSVINVITANDGSGTYNYTGYLYNSTTLRIYITFKSSSDYNTQRNYTGFTWQVVEFY